MGGQAPGCNRLEHVVLQYVVVGPSPVVGNLGPGVISHHISGAAGAERLVLADEPIHLSAVDVGSRVGRTVRATSVDVGWVVVRPLAPSGLGVRNANGGVAVAIHRNPVRPGI